MSDKYTSTATKNLDLRCNFQLCSAGHFLIMLPSSVLRVRENKIGEYSRLWNEYRSYAKDFLIEGVFFSGLLLWF